MEKDIDYEKKNRTAFLCQDFIIIINMVTTAIAVITENLKEIDISNFFYDISNIGVIFIAIIFMIIRKITIKNNSKSNNQNIENVSKNNNQNTNKVSKNNNQNTEKISKNNNQNTEKVSKNNNQNTNKISKNNNQNTNKVSKNNNQNIKKVSKNNSKKF